MAAFDLRERAAIVTGGSRGIGLAIGTALAGAGARVVLAARHGDEVEAAAAGLREAGAQVIGVAANVSKAEDCETLVEAAEAAFGQVDILVNNAATNIHFGQILDADDGMWLKMVETNLLSAVRLCRRVVPGMRARRQGKVINVASVAGIQPGVGQGVYGALKAALIQFTRSLAQEAGPDNIQVNAIAPGLVRTKFAQVLHETPQIRTAIERATPLRRIAEPDEIAGAALYLASPAADFVTGQVLVVDGGMTLGSFAAPE
ncbi:MAG: Oxidoreductase, short-chain dehydrogenase/reductase family [Ktedonobacterales bacterium]|jgi:NAD(P)-dependent dehydrogenase (short-subunit alcohol dehydrogenase family)|nr:MAG: Oxidoreductase, short-chain dehydrogenase/reductase family [Ktedonobacterales bacterium]